ncbi:TPA: hypothetical protein DEB00_00975 [Candidatus Uhrbacteria bacterium]|nr:hypothetical protein [Candidatus Uhrbacteria bacterium]
MVALVDQLLHERWGICVSGSAEMSDDGSIGGRFLVSGIVPSDMSQAVKEDFSHGFANLEWRVVSCKDASYSLSIRTQFVQNRANQVSMDLVYRDEAIFTRDVEPLLNQAEECLFLIVLAMQAELRRQIEATAVGGLVCTQRFLEAGFLPETERDIEFRLYATEADVRELRHYLVTRTN